MNDTKKSLSDLKEWDKNPRSISKENFERLKKQIQKLGVYKPLLISEDNTILGGNMRYKALQALGYKDVWVSVVKADTEEKKIEYALSDNDRAGQYEGDQLSDLIGNFPTVEWGDYAVDIKPPLLLTDLIDQYKEVIEDEVPEVSNEPPISKLGEVYQLGKHRLMCGDATKIEDVEKLMDRKKADMVFTDPPYGMDLDTDFETMSARSNKVKGVNYRKVIGDDKLFKMSDFHWIECKEQFWWGGDYYHKELPDGGSWFVWDKRIGIIDDALGNMFELCWSKTKHRKEVIRKLWSGVTAKEHGETRVHPTQKPIELCSWFINKFSQENTIILDLFGGSGSTLIACEQTNRICYMMEIDPKYCDVIRKRYENFINNRKETANGKS